MFEGSRVFTPVLISKESQENYATLIEEGIQKVHDGEILRIGGLFLFLPMIIIYLIIEEFKSDSFYLIIIFFGLRTWIKEYKSQEVA